LACGEMIRGRVLRNEYLRGEARLSQLPVLGVVGQEIPQWSIKAPKRMQDRSLHH
jgi:hypothetical protein